MFFDYHQNNFDGDFETNNKVGHYVIIEANNCEKANLKATTIGIYFDDYRWYEKYGETGETEPKIYGLTLEKYKDSLKYYISNEEIIHIYYKNGKHKIHKINTKKIVEKNKRIRREKADKIWGIAFNLFGLWRKNPVRLYEEENLKTYYDKSGNLGIKKIGFNYKEPSVIEFGSKDKKDVEHFIMGAQDALKVALNTVETLKEQNLSQTPYKDGLEAVLKHLKMILR